MRKTERKYIPRDFKSFFCIFFAFAFEGGSGAKKTFPRKEGLYGIYKVKT